MTDDFIECRPPHSKYYCFNAGRCLVYFTPEPHLFCQCAQNFHGARCEYAFPEEVYGLNTGLEIDATGIALITVLVIIFVVLIIARLTYYYRQKK